MSLNFRTGYIIFYCMPSRVSTKFVLAQRDLLCNNIIVQAMKVTAPRRAVRLAYMPDCSCSGAALHARAL